MKRITTSMALTLGAVGLVSVLYASPALAQPAATEPPPPGVTIGDPSAFGNGCPTEESYDAVLLDNGKAVLITFDEGQFTAAVGPSIAAPAPSKSCTLTLPITFPEGWTYALGRAFYSGNADLGPGTLARQETTYWFLGTQRSSTRTELKGPFFNTYEREDAIDLLVWHPCGVTGIRPLITKINVAASNQGNTQSNAIINVQDAEFSVEYELNWKKCPAT